jgi:hypothetical protein
MDEKRTRMMKIEATTTIHPPHRPAGFRKRNSSGCFPCFAHAARNRTLAVPMQSQASCATKRARGWSACPGRGREGEKEGNDKPGSKRRPSCLTNRKSDSPHSGGTTPRSTTTTPKRQRVRKPKGRRGGLYGGRRRGLGGLRRGRRGRGRRRRGRGYRRRG